MFLLSKTFQLHLRKINYVKIVARYQNSQHSRLSVFHLKYVNYFIFQLDRGSTTKLTFKDGNGAHQKHHPHPFLYMEGFVGFNYKMSRVRNILGIQI